jgi:hypothetical protein
MEKKDIIIIGAGLYGLYTALFCAKQGKDVIVLECENAPFKRATYINQARVHMGYHYPRSIFTAIKSRGYFDRFNADYNFCINREFEQIYATSSSFSWTNAEQFKKFCHNANIRCEDISPSKYFNCGMCDGAFLTMEYTYDAQILKQYLNGEIEKKSNVVFKYSSAIQSILSRGENYILTLSSGEEYQTPFILNATYAGVNQIHKLLDIEPFKIKYELCEIILCKVNDALQNIGITVMDGPFFSIMPFGNTGYHSLTSVTFTPHVTSFNSLPSFICQRFSDGYCTPFRLGNCNECPAKPKSAWPYMSGLAKKYLKTRYQFEYAFSLFSMKPILMASEIDDSRPTVIRQYTSNPTFISVLSGKINTVYDLDEVLKNDNQ